MNKIEGIETLYIAGPMRGIDKLNFDAFYDAEQELRQLGYTVANPAAHDVEMGTDPDDPDPASIDLEEALHWDLQEVLKADALVLLPGWEDSRGAKLEHLVATSVGKPTYAFTKRSSYRMKAIDATPVIDVGSAGDDEVRITNEKTGGQKGQKLARFDLLPYDVLWLVAEHFGKGAKKYEARNWEKGYDWSLSLGAAQRHLADFWMGNDNDEETGSLHLVAAIFHLMALVRFFSAHPELDDRATSLPRSTEPRSDS